MEEKRITESDLILPALYLMEANNGVITTSELINSLTKVMKPQGRDAEILANRKDTYFSQKVRNLKSHDTLKKLKYADFDEGRYVITKLGAEFLKERKNLIEYLFDSSFEYADVKNNISKIYKTKAPNIKLFPEYVEEGSAIFVNHKTYRRSQKLRNIAIEHFSHNGIISCDCCGFEFSSYYGNQYGNPHCIEIHHMKPIFQYSGVSEKQTIDEALDNLLPVCPNCHRVIHRQKISRINIPLFKTQINTVQQRKQM